MRGVVVFGRCPKCGCSVPLAADGTCRDHDEDGAVRLPYDGTCAGTRFAPIETMALETGDES